MSYDPPGWYVDMIDQQIPELVTHARKQSHDAVSLANIFLDKSTGDGAELTDREHVQTLALLTGLLVRRLARGD